MTKFSSSGKPRIRFSRGSWYCKRDDDVFPYYGISPWHAFLKWKEAHRV
jgi:hypothetical protein